MRKLIALIVMLSLLATNAFAGTYMFREKASKIDRWLEAKGESGTTYDKLRNHFRGYSNLASGSLYDDVNDVMGQFGYSGALDDRLTGFFQAQTSQPNRYEAERAWWSNDSYSFDPSGGGGPSGDAFLLETGDYILLETGDYLLLQ